MLGRRTKGQAPRANGGAWVSLIVAAVWIALVGGCGVYKTSPGSVPAHIRAISIPVFENLTTEVGLDQQVSEAVINRFISDNTLRVVNEDEADAVLSGAIVGYNNAIFGFTGNVEAEQYQVAVTISCKFFDKVKNRELWKDESLTRTSNYYVVEVSGQPAQDERTGRLEAIDKIADEIFARTVDRW